MREHFLVNCLAMKNTSSITVGIDLGDKKHAICVLNNQGEPIDERSITNHRESLRRLSKKYPGALMVMEVGSHSPWISRFLTELGHRVLVANPRKVRAIYQNTRKSDERDARMLAKIARVDEALLYPIEHGSAVVAGEGFGLGKVDGGFDALAEVEAHSLPGFFGGAGGDAVVTHSGKSFGENVEEPAPDELVGRKVKDGGLLGSGVGPEEFDVALGVVSEDAFGMEGAAVDVSGEVGQGGLSAPDGLDLDVEGLDGVLALPAQNVTDFIDHGTLALSILTRVSRATTFQILFLTFLGAPRCCGGRRGGLRPSRGLSWGRGDCLR